MPDPEATPELKQLVTRLQAPSTRLTEVEQRQILTAGAAAVPLLCELLVAPQGTSRSRAASLLVQLGPLAVPEVCACLNSPNTEARQWATWTLARIAHPDSVPAVRDRLADPDVAVRSQAADALGHIGTPAAAAGLCYALGDPHERVQLTAIRAILHLATHHRVPATCVPALCEALDELHPEARCLLIEALGHLKDPRTLPTLHQALGDPHRRVRLTAAEILGQFANRSSILDLFNAFCTWEHPDCLRAGEALARLRPPVLGLWVEALDHPEASARSFAADHLLHAGPSSLPDLCICVQHHLRPETALRAAQIIQQIVEQQPTRATREILPVLERRWRQSDAPKHVRAGFLVTAKAIDRATRALRSTPIPAEPPDPDARNLPRPSLPGENPPPAPPKPRGWWESLRRPHRK